MNHFLWKQIETFDLDLPVSEYGFSTRLASENCWTVYYTAGAIIEYKRFMYLAATSATMVSPSPIVDIVWHQHLIFTQSYQNFCQLLGKKIEHIPSTHHRLEAEKFKLAKKHTTELYEAVFGKQPDDYWHCATMFDSIPLEQSNINFDNFLLLTALAFAALVPLFYFLLKPIYVQFDNPWFILCFVGICFIGFHFLDNYNRTKLDSVFNTWKGDAFVFKLSPMEVTYLLKGNLVHVLHGYVNQLMQEEKIAVQSDLQLTSLHESEYKDAWEYSVLEPIKHKKQEFYPVLLRDFLIKPAFTNVKNSMEAFKEHFKHSKVIWQVMFMNVAVLTGILVLGTVRLLTGMQQGKPVIFIFIALIVYLIYAAFWLSNQKCIISNTLIPEFYKTRYLKPNLEDTQKLYWGYFLWGNYALAAEFQPLVNYTQRHQGSSSDGGCGTSDGSSCGSSDGSGGGDGCGGCGGD